MNLSKEIKDWNEKFRHTNIKEPILDLAERLTIVEKQLANLTPTAEQLAKYPSLAEAYNEYKIIERLTIGNNKET